MKIRIENLFIASLILIAAGRVFCRSPDLFIAGNEPKTNFIRARNEKVHTQRKFVALLKERLLKYSEHDELALGISYLTGNKDELTALQKDNMVNVGVMHLIAVSGTHLAIIAGILSLGFKHFSIISKTYFVLIFCFIYAMMIGFSPSILRALVGLVLMMTIKYFGRNVSVYRTMAMIVSICLIIRPEFVKQIGFWLSVLAYFAIVEIVPLATGYLYGTKDDLKDLYRRPGFLAKSLISSIVISVITLPISLYFFGKFTWLSILANIVLLSSLPIVMGSVGLIAVLGDLVIFGISLEKILIWPLKIHTHIINVLAEQESSILDFPKKKWWYFLIWLVVFILVRFAEKNIKVGYNDGKKQKRRAHDGDEVQKLDTYIIEWYKEINLGGTNGDQKNGVNQALEKT
ncbi:ComEC/Rec2 family competence protein [Candidatus Saccharibacteria bacterium]|nr:ComEC/Rec2 family competence protein [Candidatus Saccharibacteria bacterium]